MNLGDISVKLGGELIGDASLDVDGLATLQAATTSDLAFVLENKYISDMSSSKAIAFVTFKRIDSCPNQIVVKNPRQALDLCIQLFDLCKTISPQQGPTVIDSSATVMSDVVVGAFSTIDAEVSIGERSVICERVTVGARAKIGKSCVLHPGVIIYPDVIIGDRVTIHAGSVIGSDGFGFYPENGKWNKIGQPGTVVIGDDVEIGANVAMDCGCLGNTTIGNGTKIDNLVHIAHNTKVGQHSLITAQVGCVGGTEIGNWVVIGGQVGLAQVKVGDGVQIAAKAGVTRDIAPGKIVSGFPAWDHKQEIKKEAYIRKLIKNDKKK